MKCNLAVLIVCNALILCFRNSGFMKGVFLNCPTLCAKSGKLRAPHMEATHAGV